MCALPLAALFVVMVPMDFPSAAWRVAAPEAARLDSVKLQAAVDTLKQNTPRDGVGELVIVRYGRVVWKGSHADKAHGVWSMTKSFTSTVLGLLVDQRKANLDTRAADFVSGLRRSYPRVTLRHFATMTSGYRAVGDETTGGYKHGPSTTPFEPLDTPLFAPGAKYAYWDSAMNQFANVLTRVAGEPIRELFRRKIAEPIGMAFDWGDFGPVNGVVVNGGAGSHEKHVRISALEIARLGHLYLNQGSWDGRRLLSASWVKAATSPQVPANHPLGFEPAIDGRGVYGFNWWTNGRKPDGGRKWPSAPASTFWASGRNNNGMFVIPEWGMVIVRLGLDETGPSSFKIPDATYDAFLRAIGGAMLGAARPASVTSQPDGGGGVKISGELKRWHKVTLTLDGPFADERDAEPNPFTDHRMTVTFTHESGSPRTRVPGYFAADGEAAHTSARSGTKWRAHLSPDKTGRWSYELSFVTGKGAAVSDIGGEPLRPFDALRGSFRIAETDKRGRDFRAKGRLQYVGKHHLRFAGTGEYFLKAGPDAPETFLAYADFDDTMARKEKVPLKTWSPHVRDWRPGDPAWQNGKGKGLIGALNYLAGKGLSSFSFLTYNAGGDGDNVWPFVERDDKLHYDCSKLDQWGIVFDHAQRLGLFLHFKLQETENDDQRVHKDKKQVDAQVPEALDGGALGPERKLYLRELCARFGHALALSWNLGEENTQSPAEQRDMAQFIRDTDPYQHLRVLHTFPGEQDKVYTPLLGETSALTGASLQNPWDAAHQRTLRWVAESAKAGKPWVVANDEQGSAALGVPPDPGYAGFAGMALHAGKAGYDLHDVRKATLWGTLMAGGAGVEYYFGYELPENDLVAEDFRSRDRSWDYCRNATAIFRNANIPFWDMKNADALVGNAANDNGNYCLAKPGEIYAVYLPSGGNAQLDLGSDAGSFSVAWWNPRTGGRARNGSVKGVEAGSKVALGDPPSDREADWLVVVRRPHR